MDSFRPEDDVKWKSRKPQSCIEFQAEQNRHLICSKRSLDAACAGPTSRISQEKTLVRARPMSGGLVHPPTPPFGPYIASVEKTLTQKDFAKYDSELRRHPEQVSGDRTLFRHPAGTGNCPRSHLHRLHRHLHRRC